MSVGVDWNARGTPTSTDTIIAYDLAGQTSGGHVRKTALNGAPGSVAVNYNAAAASPQWTVVLYEILAPVSASSPSILSMGRGIYILP